LKTAFLLHFVSSTLLNHHYVIRSSFWTTFFFFFSAVVVVVVVIVVVVIVVYEFCLGKKKDQTLEMKDMEQQQPWNKGLGNGTHRD
jgi:heme/copper-type cytochrome/quinol oxidase subunit 2